MPTVSVVIVNYNGERYLDKLLESLEHQTFKDFEIIFVDNMSKDNSLFLVKKHQGRLPIRVIENEENVGFCLANNMGFQASNGEYICFLNNDTFVDPRWLELLVKRAETDTKIGAVTCSILYPGSGKVKEGPMLYDIYGATLCPANERFFYGTGASLLVKRDLLCRIGVFDPKLFMYQDDVDLCWRIRLYGYEIAYEPKAICYHLKDSKGAMESNLKMPLWKFYHAHCKNRIRVLVKNYSKANVIRRIPMVLFFIFLRSLVLSFTHRSPQYVLAYIKGLFGNLRILKETLMERFKVQGIRKKTDAEIEAYMVRYPVELLFVSKISSMNRIKK
jgi:GT2 family glycosyltransferase